LNVAYLGNAIETIAMNEMQYLIHVQSVFSLAS